MSIILLGASGFVGCNILDDLVADGQDVIAVSRSQTTHQKAQPGVRWQSLESLKSLAPSDVSAIICFAGVGNPAAFETHPDESMSAELAIADLVIEIAQRYRVEVVVYLSTAGAAYGEGLRGSIAHSFRETDSCNPMSVYGKAKLAAEAHITARLGCMTGSPRLIILRASNIYGFKYSKAGQQGLVNALIERARQRQPITVFGDGLIYRDYIFASDIASAILATLACPASGLFNIGSGTVHSILEVIEAVEDAMELRFERRCAPARPFDVKYCALSIERARSVLNWIPRISLEQGIRRIVSP